MNSERTVTSDNQPHPAQLLRDLRWAVESPALITHSTAELSLPALPEPGEIDERELEEFMAPYSRFRVGQYFEGLILFWLERIRGLKIIAQHQQVFENEQTIGEIDFLFEDEAGVLTHWETAVKFYLYCPEDNPAGSRIIGPNVKDTFERKMRRLLEHQLPLSKKHFPEVTRRQAYVKGMIFYHPDHEPPAQLHECLSPLHLRGTWLHFSELNRLHDQVTDSLFLIREKPDWLSASLCNKKDPRLLSLSDLKQHLQTHFQKSDRPILISHLTAEQTCFQEVNRLFIVPNHWPQIR